MTNVIDATRPMTRASAKLPDQLEIAFESVFESVSAMFRNTGLIRHQVIGMGFCRGRAVSAHIQPIWVMERLLPLVNRMRRNWDVVAHVQLTHFGRDKPTRSAIAEFRVFGARVAVVARCVVDPLARQIDRGNLVVYEEAEPTA